MKQDHSAGASSGKMDPELKAKWVAALRSGKYEQGFRRLRSRDDWFCANGVLLDVADPAGWKQSAMNRSEYTHRYGAMCGYGIRDEYDVPEGALDHAVVLNDMRRQSFPEIADWIEKNL